jgi:LuxR family maltose regulon positive regulatory protein
MNSPQPLTRSGQTDWQINQPLTHQEKVILHFIAAGLSRKEIAAQLVVSLNTIKTHTQNLYGKLQAHSRKQAICHAQQFGLLTTNPVILNTNGHYAKPILNGHFKLK